MPERERKPMFNMRTKYMSDELYEFLEKQINQMPDKTFREYAYKLIIQDFEAHKEIEKNKKKDKHVYDLLLDLEKKMDRQFSDLNKQLSEKTFVAADRSDKLSFNAERLKDKDLSEIDISGDPIEEDLDADF
jgi:hypothetical protein